jgi:hypothetical protein
MRVGRMSDGTRPISSVQAELAQAPEAALLAAKQHDPARKCRVADMALSLGRRINI